MPAHPRAAVLPLRLSRLLPLMLAMLLPAGVDAAGAPVDAGVKGIHGALSAPGPLASLSGGDAGPPALLLANVMGRHHDPSAYWVSEKLDGVRAYWDGKELRSRGGLRIMAPAWFTAPFPQVVLDGELWIGRGLFEKMSGLARRATPVDADWREVRYMVFELPGAAGDFSERLAQLQRIANSAKASWLRPVRQFRVADRAALQRHLDEIVQLGGEGLMLHRADATYVTGRNDALLKLKPFLDAEARVIAHVPGKGKYEGMTGALLVEMPDGRRFRLGSGLSDAQRGAPPPVGALVTYRYRDQTESGLPRFATFLRVREGP